MAPTKGKQTAASGPEAARETVGRAIAKEGAKLDASEGVEKPKETIVSCA